MLQEIGKEKQNLMLEKPKKGSSRLGNGLKNQVHLRGLRRYTGFIKESPQWQLSDRSQNTAGGRGNRCVKWEVTISTNLTVRERKEQKSEDNWRHFLPVLLLLNKGNKADAGK